MKALSEVYFKRLLRTCLDLLPALSDVEVVSGDNGDMLVRGHYYKTEFGLSRRQSWFLVPAVEH